MKSKDFKQSLLALIFIASFAGIAIDVYANARESGILCGLSIFKFFTLQSNLLIAIYSFIALFNIKGYNEKPFFKSLLSPVTSYIMLTGLTFAILLAPTSTAIGLHKVASDILHYLVPPLMTFFWLIFEDRKLEYGYVPKWLIYPVVFMAWGLFRSFAYADYLYPFFDLSKFGYFLIIYLISMAIATFAIGLLLVFVNKKLQNNRVS
jgi:hypothetical protein